MKRIVHLFFLMMGLQAAAQTTTYSISSIPYNPDPFTGGTPSGVNIDDYWGPVVQLPFSFCFFSNQYDKLVIGSNGVVTFDTAQAFNGCPWVISAAAPDATCPDLSIMAPWQDIDPAIGGSITYAVNGVAPYRRFVVSYYQIPMYSCNGMLFSEQVILYETTNIIEVFIQNKPLCSTWNGGAAILGIQQNMTNAYVAPGRNFPTQWTAVNEGWRFQPAGFCYGGGAPCSISGKAWRDVNANCTFDAGEVPFSNRSVLVNGGAYYAWTDTAGNYSTAVPTGNWTVTSASPAYYQPVCPASGSYNVSFTVAGSSATNQDFADTANVTCADLYSDIATANFSRCLTETVYLDYGNQGTITEPNATLTVTLIDSLTLDSASMPYTQSGNTVTFAMGTLIPGASGTIMLYVSVGCDVLGTVYCIGSNLSGTLSNDCNPANNSSQDCHAIIGAVDPNDKYVASQSFQSNGWVTEEFIPSTAELRYLINFQNTGNDTAFTVEVRDTLSAGLDPASVTGGVSSAPYQMVVLGNVVVFRFDQINLPDSNTNEPASHGFVTFRVSQVPGNPDGTLIDNSAAIYFDFNPPIITNTTENIVCDNPPVAATGITVTPAQYCIGDVVTLTVSGGNAGSGGDWEWKQDCQGAVLFNGNSISWTVTGADQIVVNANSICGTSACTGITLSPQVAPTAAFTSTPNQLSVDFTDASTGNPTSWNWNFGDAGTSTQQNPTHVYSADGTYNVTLEVTGDCGTDQLVQVVTVTSTALMNAWNGAVKVYPNPTSGSLFIDLKPVNENLSATLLDVSGRAVQEFSLRAGETNEVQLRAPAGFYQLLLTGETTQAVVKVVVE